MRTVLVMCGLLASTVVSADGGQPLRLAATPAQAFSPSTVRIQLRIEPSADNRVLTVVVDSGDFYRSSEIPLNGELAQRTVMLEYPNMPGGEYAILGVLTDRYGRQRATASQAVRLIPQLGH